MFSGSCRTPLILAVFCLLYAVESRFRCHNRCSGHGYCSDYDNICYCEVGFQGVDCSQRTCPTFSAWADKAYDVDSAHTPVECSGVGRCNRRTGRCECSAGFTGVACENTKCGGAGFDGCNGHGDCLTMRETYLQVGAFKGINTAETFDAEGQPLWDHQRTTMCSCHPGYAGASCEYRLCPKGDDRLTPHTGHRTITITINSQSRLNRLSGEFHFQFNGESFLFPTLRTSFSAAKCKAAFEALRNVKEVTCSVTGTDYESVYTVSFLKFPVLPYENNIFAHDGNPPLSAFSCNIDRVVKFRASDALVCRIGELNTDKTYPENVPCSNRGICDFSAGVCYCFEQFTDANCGSYRKAIAQPSERAVSTSEVLTIETSSADFDKTVLQFQTFDIGTPAFSVLKADNMDTTVFQMDGYGNINMNQGSLVIGDSGWQGIASGMTVDSGGLQVTGGVTAFTDTLVIAGPVQVKGGGVEIGNGGFTVQGAAEINGLGHITGGFQASRGLTVSNGLHVAAGGGTIGTGGLLLRDGVTIFSSGLVLNKRGVTIYTGGLVVTGGIQLLKVRSSITVGTVVEIQSDGFTVTGGITAEDSGMSFSSLSIGANGLVAQTVGMTSGGVFANGGLTVATLGLVVAGGMTVNSLGMYVTSGPVSTSNSVSGLTVHDSGVVVANGMEVASGGLVVEGGMTIPTGDMYISPTTPVLVSGGVLVTGGLSVMIGGMSATGGITVHNLGLQIDVGGLTVAGGGLRVNGGLTVEGDGQRVTGGITVNNNGFVANDRVTITLGGAGVIGGLTVSNVGVMVTHGVTVRTSGLRVTNGLSILSAGVRVTGGLTVTPDGLAVTGGVTVYTQGLRVTGGLTNFGSSGFTLTGGLSVESPGMSVSDGMTVYNSGLNIVADGLTVHIGGLQVTSGLTITNGGLAIDSGGLSVESNSLRVTGGLTIGDPAAVTNVVNSMTIYDGGRITGGWTTSTGMSVGQGVTVSAAGLSVTGGMSILYAGASVFAGTVLDLGVRVTGGLSISTVGVDVAISGLTVHSNGAVVTGGITVQSSGLRTTGGLSIRSAGLRIVDGGATIENIGLVVSGGLTITQDGFESEGASDFRITSGGLSMADQLKVGANGARVTGGLTVVDTGASIYSLVVRRNGIHSDGRIDGDGGMVIYGDSTIKSGGLHITGGLTVRAGMSFSGSTSTFVNSITAGQVYVRGASAVEVRTGGAFSGNGLTVNGAVYLSSTPTISDARLKTNVTLLSNPLYMLATIRGVYYNWKDPAWDVQSGRLGPATTAAAVSNLERQQPTSHNPSPSTLPEEFSTTEHRGASDGEGSQKNGTLRFVGLLAQQVQSVLPEVVALMQFGGTNYLGVKYTDLVALLVEAIKEIDLRTKVVGEKKPSFHRVEDHHSIVHMPESAATLDEGLLRKYFEYGNDYGNITAVKDNAATCACAQNVLSEIVVMLRRLKNLEDEEVRLTQQIRSMQLL